MALMPQTQNFPPNYNSTTNVDPTGFADEPVPPQRRPNNPYARRQSMPVPPIPPPSNTGNVPFTGLQVSQNRDPRYDPNMLSTEDTTGADPLSPTTIVLNYLKQKGYPLTAENIRRTVEANARDPGVLGQNVAQYTRDGAPVELRNAGTEGSSAPPTSSATKRTPAAQSGENPQWDLPPDQPRPIVPQYVPMPDAGAPPIGQPPPPVNMPPPTDGAAVGGAPQPQLPPPPAGAANAQPSPPDPVRDAITRAISGPPEAPALPAPPVRPQIAAPPEVPALPAPAPQLALPAPPGVSAAPQLNAPPEIPRIIGQSGRPPLALPAPAPNISTSTTLRGQPTPMRVAPGNPIQGAPIQAGPVAGAIPRVAGGALAGGARGGLGGAILGGLSAAAPELLPYVMKNLHLR